MDNSYDSKKVDSSEYSKCAESISALQHSNYPRNKKALEDLNLIDAFMFDVSTEKIQNAEVIAKVIVERATGKKLGRVIIEAEKSIRGIDTLHHGIRLDLFISELEHERVARVYDIEPNNYDLKKLPKRERYNQALSDVKLLGSGQDFDVLPEYISIWILPDDPFGAGRMIYTVKNIVAENNKIVYNDGVNRLFLNAKGTVGGNEKLRALLNYFCHSCKENATDPELLELHSIVNDVKESRKVGERYMSYMTFQEFAKYEARAIVEEEIREEITEKVTKEVTKAVTEEVTKAVTEEVTGACIDSLVRTCAKLGATKECIIESLMAEYSLTKEQATERISKIILE